MNLVNAPYYGQSKRVGNIDQAVETLGTRAIKNIALITSYVQAFSRPEDRYVLCLKAFWKHSLMCAVLSELIAKKISATFNASAEISGILISTRFSNYEFCIQDDLFHHVRDPFFDSINEYFHPHGTHFIFFLAYGGKFNACQGSRFDVIDAH